MRAPVTWLQEIVGQTEPVSGEDVAAALVRVGLEEEGLHGGDLTGPLVVGRVLSKTDEPQKNGKTIHFCTVDVGDHGQRAAAGGDPAVVQEIVCGAHNFDVGDLVVVVLPGAVLPGGFAISARKTYGHLSNGMICAEDEIGLGTDHAGIIVLSEYLADDPDTLARIRPGDDAIALLGLDEEVVEVNVTPDRGYCFSLRGIAREYALSTGLSGFVDPVSAGDDPEPNDAGPPVRLQDDAPLRGRVGCDRYVARVVRGIDPSAPTPRWMVRRLEQMGMRSISLAVDVTNYLMLLTGQPLHAFDLHTLSGAIEVRRARAGETLTTLDDVERTLSVEDLLITDGGTTPLAIAGVMGGETSEVGPTTTDVLVESAHFDPVSVARSSRRHKLSTEASRRYERGVDPQIAGRVAALAVAMLARFGGGTIDPGVTDVRAGAAEAVTIEFDTASAWALVQPASATNGQVPDGLDHAGVVATLRALGCTVSQDAGDSSAADAADRAPGFARVHVVPPSWRPDLRTGPDLIEEVARIRGYEHIPSILPTAPGGRGLTPGQRSARLASAVLAGLGAIEVWSYPFVAEDLVDRLGYPAGDPRRRAVRILNPLSDEAPLMRTSLLDTLLSTLRLNVGRGRRDALLFEVGLVARPEGDAAAPVPPVGARPDDATLAAVAAAVPPQPRHVAFVAAGDAVPAGPAGPAVRHDAAGVISTAIELGAALGVDLTPVAAQEAPWHPGRCAALTLPDGRVAGYAGELHPKVAATLELPARTCAAELDLDLLRAAGRDIPQVGTLSTYPVATSDVALVVDEAVAAGDVARHLREGAGADLEALTLFDVYRGDQVGPQRKSLAFRLTFRSAGATLTTEQVSGLRDAAVDRAAAALGAFQRA
ncbi:phenylalanine--tRNA ligase subunit beta [Agilicoccus flavus]|uniref:phenylalanine--tRNA ligase subunit beta n=1 Tax=Agilicoccus flavus TaxID=2775968 RepID=UPI001CF716E7|nr:phenylalanine--tRNA ligase subunit beta [Agilicoccus flavus]